MTLQLHRPDGEGGLEPVPTAEDWRDQLQSPRWGAALEGERLPSLKNPEMNPTSRFQSVLFWLGLGLRDVPDPGRRLRDRLLEPAARLTAAGRDGDDEGGATTLTGRIASGGAGAALPYT